MISEDNNGLVVSDDDGMYQQQQPLTFEKVWLMFQDTDKKFQETDKKFQETDKKFQETREEIRETGRIVRNLSKEVGGIGNNIGEVAEEYFRGALENMKEFGGIKIEHVSHFGRKGKNIQAEYDVVVFGKDTLVVVEVKHKLTRDHVSNFVSESIPKFIVVFPEYSGYKIMGAVAGMTTTKSAVNLAISKGLFVITQSGQKIEFLNPEGFKPKEFPGKVKSEK